MVRLSLAVFVGGIIGWNRQVTGKPAGLRTHMLVSMGSALFVMVTLQVDTTSVKSDALSRSIQGVATGIGFLGAGVIFRESQQDISKVKVHGLTSAAAIWVSAALGITIGCGLWPMGLMGGLLTLLILSGIKRLERYTLIRRDLDD